MKCPGLAIMVVDFSSKDQFGTVKLPYEFAPLPEKDDIVMMLDRGGEPVGEGKVTAVILPPNKTAVVTIKLAKSLIKSVRSFRPKDTGEAIVCRCGDLTVSEIRRYIDMGYTSVNELKRILRLGMGPCQGRTCIPVVMRELAAATGESFSEMNPGTFRPMVTSVTLGAIAEAENEK
jgi:bacterioferritin-associated ferredoxin